MTFEQPSQPHWISFSGNAPPAFESSSSKVNRKQVVIAATCSNTELRKLMQTIAEVLDSVSFSITSHGASSTIESPTFYDGESRYIVVTASCLSNELGKLMQMVTDTMGFVSFTVSSDIT